MPTPDLDDLDAFAAIARAGGFRIAAARRGVSASALSEALRRLEAKLGVRLINRTTRAMTLTDAGSHEHSDDVAAPAQSAPRSMR